LGLLRLGRYLEAGQGNHGQAEQATDSQAHQEEQTKGLCNAGEMHETGSLREERTDELGVAVVMVASRIRRKRS